MFNAKTRTTKCIPSVLGAVLVFLATPVFSTPIPAQSDWDQLDTAPKYEDLSDIANIGNPITLGPPLDPLWSDASTTVVGTTSISHALHLTPPAGTVYFSYELPDSITDGAFAWRIGTSTAPGPDHRADGDWYEVFRDSNGTSLSRVAASEADLDSATFQSASSLGIDTNAFLYIDTWTLQLSLETLCGGHQGSNRWELQLLAADGSDWTATGTVLNAHFVPEPSTLALMGASSLLLLVRMRRKA